MSSYGTPLDPAILLDASSPVFPREMPLRLNSANVHSYGVAETVAGVFGGPIAGYTFGVHISKVKPDWTSALAQHETAALMVRNIASMEQSLQEEKLIWVCISLISMCLRAANRYGPHR